MATEKEVNLAFDNEFDGVESFLLVQEILDLRTKLAAAKEALRKIKNARTVIGPVDERLAAVKFLSKVILELKNIAGQALPDVGGEEKRLEKERRKPHKCRGCDEIIYYQDYCQRCERHWAS